MIIAFEVIVNNMFEFYKNNINMPHLYLFALRFDSFLSCLKHGGSLSHQAPS